MKQYEVRDMLVEEFKQENIPLKMNLNSSVYRKKLVGVGISPTICYQKNKTTIRHLIHQIANGSCSSKRPV
jgi:hypothetical protein